MNTTISMRKRNDSGAMTLEAMIFVTMFMLIMLILAGLFPMFMMKNASSHALIQASTGMSLDAYALKAFNYEVYTGPESLEYNKVTKIGNIGDVLENEVFGKMIGTNSGDTMFATDGYWYDEKVAADGEVAAACRKMYIAYLAGSETNAEQYLKRVNVRGGLAGLNFAKSKVENGVLTITVEYDLEYPFKIWGLDAVHVEQSAKARLWQ